MHVHAHVHMTACIPNYNLILCEMYTLLMCVAFEVEGMLITVEVGMVSYVYMYAN